MTTSSAALEGALGLIDAEGGAMVELLRALVERSSATSDPGGCASVAAVLEAALRRLGVQRPEGTPPDLVTVERIESTRGFGPQLAFRTAVRGPPVFLVGHLDTVFPRETFSGFRVEGDRAFGPGVFDMKGGLVVMLAALGAAARAGLLAHVPVAGLVVSDEEVGSPESQPLLRERVRGAACALVFESGRPGDLVVTRRKGVASVHAEARGVAAHAGNEPEKGRSAIWTLARFVDRAQGLSDPARGRSVNVGLFHGGTSKNTVPDRAACDVDLRFLTAEDGRALEAALRDAASEATLPGTTLELTRGGVRAPLERSPDSAALAAEYGGCQRRSGLGAGEAPLAGGGSDACTTSEVGVPTIDGLGPRGAGYHTTSEEVDLSSLVPKAQALLRFLAGRAL
jgi:glutamate carboxypeptidase